MPFDPDAPAAAGSLFGLPHGEADARVLVQAVPWEATTSYRRGTREGPAAVLAASAQVDLHDVDFGDAWRAGIALLPEDPHIRAWDAAAEADALAVIAGDGDEAAAARVNALSDKLNHTVYRRARDILDKGRIPALLGGDHSTPFGAIRAVAERFPGVGILHVDAHADLREAYEGFTHSHASIMHNVLRHVPNVAHIVQVGVRDVGAAEVAMIEANPERLTTFYDATIAAWLAEGESWNHVVDAILEALPGRVYVSFDIDGLDPALCPGTGTPVPGGLSWRDTTVLLKRLSERRQIVGFDLNEVGPGEWDGNVAARLLYKLFGATIRSAGQR
jgi:agmatinase